MSEHSGMDVDEATEIIPGKLWLGSVRVAQDLSFLRALGITHVVDASAAVPLGFQIEHSGIEYMRVYLYDDPRSNIENEFERSSSFIADALSTETGRVFVHCLVGVSRSPTIVIAYLMRCRAMKFFDAFNVVSSQRPVISPIPSFLGSLVRLEHSLFPESGLSLDDVLVAEARRQLHLQPMSSPCVDDDDIRMCLQKNEKDLMTTVLELKRKFNGSPTCISPMEAKQ